MSEHKLRITQEENGEGRLQIDVVTRGMVRPIEGAVIQIAYTGDPENVIMTLTTDSSGQTESVTLPAPPVEYSMQPEEFAPYAQYTIRISVAGYKPVDVTGVAVLPEETAIQNVALERETEEGEDFVDIIIPPHTLYGDYPEKIPESEIKPVDESGEIVLSRVVIPEYIVVHDGAPTDSTARDYYVRYRDYIKNVASSEIYATWPDATIRANVLAIMSFALNRVYTEFYRNRGYDFTITSSTAYDQKWSYGRTIYSNISQVVDEMFANYLSRPNVRQPILTQYCDGARVSCPNWMSQWGSKTLGDQGYSTIQILRYYYGNSIYINTAQEISGIPASWPRVNLQVGSSGEKVRQIQEQLNAIARAYPALPTVTVDGVYGNRTREAVSKFQSIFGLPVTGIIDYTTWYKISAIYVAVTRMAELN